MRAFWILSCLVLAAAKPQYSYEQPASQYYTSNVVQQQYPANGYVEQHQQQQQQQLFSVGSSYAGQNQAAYVQHQSLPVSYASLGSSVSSQPQTAAFPSQNLYTRYAQSPSYQELITHSAPGVSYTGYKPLQLGYASVAPTSQSSFVQGEASNNGYYINAYSQPAIQQAPLVPKQTYLPAAYTAAPTILNANSGPFQQLTNQYEQLQGIQASVQQSTSTDHGAIPVSSHSADVAQQHFSADQKLPQQSLLQSQGSILQVDSTSVPQLEQSSQSGYQQAEMQSQPAQSYLPVGIQQSYQNQPEQSYQPIQQIYKVQAEQNEHSVDVQKAVKIQPEQHHQSVQQAYQNEDEQSHKSLESLEVHQSFQNKPQQPHLDVVAQGQQSLGVHQSFQSQSEQSLQSEVTQGQHSLGVHQSFQTEPEPSYQSEVTQGQQSVGVHQSFQTQPEQSLQNKVTQGHQSLGVYQSFQTQPRQSFQSEVTQGQQSVGVHQSFQTQPEQSYQSEVTQGQQSLGVHQSIQSQPEPSYQSEVTQGQQSLGVHQSFRSQPEQSYQSVQLPVQQSEQIGQSFQNQPIESLKTQSENVFQSPTVLPSTAHEQTFQPQTQVKTDPRALQPAIETNVHKSIFVHVPPKELEEEESLPVQPVSPPKKHYKVIFIKAPNPVASRQIIQPIQPQEEKTIVYVLVGKPEAPELRHVQQPEYKSTDKPEVYFIKYRTQKGNDQVSAAVQPSEMQSVNTVPLPDEPTIIDARQSQSTQTSQLTALPEQNGEVANDEIHIPSTTRQIHHHLRLNSSKNLRKSSEHKPAKDYLPANLS